MSIHSGYAYIYQMKRRRQSADDEGGVALGDDKEVVVEEKRRKVGGKKSSVVYVGRIPHGFYEDQMRKFFSQFGDIQNLRLSRNRKVCLLQF